MRRRTAVLKYCISSRRFPIRPFLFATDEKLGVHAPSKCTFAIILSPVGPYFPEGLIEQNEDGGKRRNAARKKELEAAEKRIGELSAIFKRLYEDSVRGRISDERFTELSADYEACLLYTSSCVYETGTDK